MKTNNNICAYCGTSDPETRDHVPPKSIFAPPRPSNLITVPCCNDCHSDTSDDDEYFRNMLAMRHDTFDHFAVKEILPKVLRSYARPKKVAFLNNLLKSIKKVNLVTSKGVYLKEAHTYDVDNLRLDKVVERIVRGIYLYENKKIYPTHGKVKSYGIDFIDGLESDKIHSINDALAKGYEKSIGESSFRYRMAKSDREYNELWLLTFYDRVSFFVFLIT